MKNVIISVFIGMLIFLVFVFISIFLYFLSFINERHKDIADDYYNFLIEKVTPIFFLYLMNIPFWTGTISYYIGGFDFK